MEDLQKMKECPDCASMNILYSQVRDQVICRDCGLIFEPLVPEVEAKFERTHGMKFSQKARGRPSRLEKNIKSKKVKPKVKKKAIKKQVKKSSKKSKPKKKTINKKRR